MTYSHTGIKHRPLQPPALGNILTNAGNSDHRSRGITQKDAIPPNPIALTITGQQVAFVMQREIPCPRRYEYVIPVTTHDFIDRQTSHSNKMAIAVDDLGLRVEHYGEQVHVAHKLSEAGMCLMRRQCTNQALLFFKSKADIMHHLLTAIPGQSRSYRCCSALRTRGSFRSRLLKHATRVACRSAERDPKLFCVKQKIEFVHRRPSSKLRNSIDPCCCVVKLAVKDTSVYFRADIE